MDGEPLGEYWLDRLRKEVSNLSSLESAPVPGPRSQARVDGLLQVFSGEEQLVPNHGKVDELPARFGQYPAR